MNSKNEISNSIINFANKIFIILIIYFFFLLVYLIYKISNLPNETSIVFYIQNIIFLSVIFFTLIYGLRNFSNNLKVNLSIIFISLAMTLYAVEIYLIFSKKSNVREKIAKQMNISYDNRSYAKVLEDLSTSGIKIFPNIFPNEFRFSNGIKSEKSRIYPLGSISKFATVYDNEGGYFPIIELDEHGFNNPKGLYNKDEVDIVLVGDSFTESKSVHAHQSISAVLSEKKLNSISLGKEGNGPLIQLATIKEFAEPLKAKVVLWVYYVNDLRDLNSELDSSILKKYLYEDDFSQNLINRQEEVDEILIEYIEILRKKELKRQRNLIESNFETLFKLGNIRSLFNLKPKFAAQPQKTLDIFQEVLAKAKKNINLWGGKLYFVYLPSFQKFKTGNDHNDRAAVLEIVRNLNVPIIDIQNEVFLEHSDPISLFPLRIHGHYNEDGYRMVAEEIYEKLIIDQIFK